MDRNLVVTLVLIVLLVISGVQAIQLSNVGDDLKSDTGRGIISSGQNSGTSTTQPVSTGMVGGC